ncbi:MAG: hypothetical protein KAS72_12710 [Phycisphaerales bacterium]|nr:hypothetical protein [Phycisphaerales bacterium]
MTDDVQQCVLVIEADSDTQIQAAAAALAEVSGVKCLAAQPVPQSKGELDKADAMLIAPVGVVAQIRAELRVLMAAKYFAQYQVAQPPHELERDVEANLPARVRYVVRPPKADDDEDARKGKGKNGRKAKGRRS